MEYDVVIVGAGPAGLSSAILLRQLALENNLELTVCVLEKGSEVGSHILSGAVLEPTALTELIPDWQEQLKLEHTPVSEDEVFVLLSEDKAIKIPKLFIPKTMHNKGNFIISLGDLCRQLAEYAESLDVEIYPGFAASEILYDDAKEKVIGVATGDMGIAANGEQKDGYEPGMELHGKYTLFAEGCRGHLGKQLIDKFKLDKDSQAQHYGIGIKELWKVEPTRHKAGLVMHTAGWPLNESNTQGGSFLYHLDDDVVSIGLITDLNYSNPHVDPFNEFQRFKHHPRVSQYLEGGKRISYGARAIAKGGIQALPKMNFPGGLLIGCDAGTLNFAKIKGVHTAMKSGMVAAEVIVNILINDTDVNELVGYGDAFKRSWAYQELYTQRNFGPAQHKLGNVLGSAYAFMDINILNGKLPFTLNDPEPDHLKLNTAGDSKKINYQKPDGEISFDRFVVSVFIEYQS